MKVRIRFFLRQTSVKTQAINCTNKLFIINDISLDDVANNFKSYKPDKTSTTTTTKNKLLSTSYSNRFGKLIKKSKV